MGLGKTIQTIIHLGVLAIHSDNLRPHLIVVPASTLGNWKRELQIWGPHLITITYEGNQQQRLELAKELLEKPRCCQVVLTTVDSCTKNDNDRLFFHKFKFCYLVLDEAHSVKNILSQRFRHLHKIQTEYRLLLTGTPIQNSLSELVSLLAFLIPSGSETLQRWALELQANGSDTNKDVIAQVKTILRPFILRRLKSEVLNQMVGKSSYVEWCPMSERQQQIYQQSLQASRAAAAESASKRTLQNVTMQLRKAANHPLLHRVIFTPQIIDSVADIAIRAGVFEPDVDFLKVCEHLLGLSDFALHRMCVGVPELSKFLLPREMIFGSGKFDMLFNRLLPALQQGGHRVLLFSQFTIMLDIVEEAVRMQEYGYLRLDGNTPVSTRQSLIDQFNSNQNIFLFLLSTRAGGLGLNLTAADTVILHDIDWNPQTDLQAEDRAHRLGQTKPVTVYRLLSSGSIDEYMYRVAERKRNLNEDVLSLNNDIDDEENIDDDIIREILDLIRPDR
eukprot:TRINITY_DN5226_c0_g1_i2.p1 TRINITY_DN5226_c0_g1~~TRINITY_DN5226_c0_g1_i2.p1  ORF type:complete len:558 (-),score=128.31 TRINITY_DN5226_c0_g1_i2:92-1603(-)